MWAFVLLASLGGLIMMVISGLLIDVMGDWALALVGIYVLALAVPFSAISVRRLRDMGWPAMAALLYLVPVIGILLLVPLLLLPNAARIDARRQQSLARRAAKEARNDARRQQSLARRAAKEARNDARRQLSLAREAAREAVSRADAESLALSSAQARLAELESGRGAYLGSAGQAVLHEFWISVPGYSGPVCGARAHTTQNGDLHSISEVSGQTKGGLGGAVVGGLVFGPVGAIVGSNIRRKTTVTTAVRTVDTRSYQLQVTGPSFNYVMESSDPSSLNSFRNLVNARGSSSEDVQSMAATQRAHVQQQIARTMEAKAAADAANDAASERESQLRAVRQS